jgi:hypothetical protein
VVNFGNQFLLSGRNKIDQNISKKKSIIKMSMDGFKECKTKKKPADLKTICENMKANPNSKIQKMTLGYLDTLKKCDPTFVNKVTAKPRRILTQPQKGIYKFLSIGKYGSNLNV